VAQSANDDAMIMWLSDRSQAAADFAWAYLLGHNGDGNDINASPKVIARGRILLSSCR